jgi:hypothetical protein
VPFKLVFVVNESARMLTTVTMVELEEPFESVGLTVCGRYLVLHLNGISML